MVQVHGTQVHGIQVRATMHHTALHKVPRTVHHTVHHLCHQQDEPLSYILDINAICMDRPTRSRALAAILGAIGLALGLYLCAGGGGYYTFGR